MLIGDRGTMVTSVSAAPAALFEALLTGVSGDPGAKPSALRVVLFRSLPVESLDGGQRSKESMWKQLQVAVLMALVFSFAGYLYVKNSTNERCALEAQRMPSELAHAEPLLVPEVDSADVDADGDDADTLGKDDFAPPPIAARLGDFTCSTAEMEAANASSSLKLSWTLCFATGSCLQPDSRADCR